MCVHHTVQELSQAAANDVREAILHLLSEKEEVNVVFAGAVSQEQFHREIVKLPDIPWERINAFSIDEFYCPNIEESCTVAAQPKRDLYSAICLKSIHTINGQAQDPQAESERYAALLEKYPPDIVCMGVGVTGHLGLNEPGDTRFDEPRMVRVAKVTEKTKKQLRRDPNFRPLTDMPDYGITVTVSALMKSKRMFVLVPYAEKAEIVRDFFAVGVTEDLPATIIKTHPGATLYLDAESNEFSQV